MVISRFIALVYDPVKPRCFNSQVNIYLDDFQLSKTVFILGRFCTNKLSILADKGCLILVPPSDLFRPHDFYQFDRFEMWHFLPFLRQNATRRCQFLHAKFWEDGTFLLQFALFSLIKTQILALEGMMNVKIQWFIVLKLFCFIILGKIGFAWWLPVATAPGELEIYMPANVMEQHAVGPQPAYKTLKDSLIILVGSIVKKKWAFLYMYFAIFSVYV